MQFGGAEVYIKYDPERYKFAGASWNALPNNISLMPIIDMNGIIRLWCFTSLPESDPFKLAKLWFYTIEGEPAVDLPLQIVGLEDEFPYWSCVWVWRWPPICWYPDKMIYVVSP